MFPIIPPDCFNTVIIYRPATRHWHCQGAGTGLAADPLPLLSAFLQFQDDHGQQLKIISAVMYTPSMTGKIIIPPPVKILNNPNSWFD
jgi:hypothetical protein